MMLWASLRNTLTKRHLLSQTLNIPTELQGSRGRTIAVCCVCLFFVFAVVIFLNYGVHNDYYIFQYDSYSTLPWKGYPETAYQFWIGRPLFGLLLNVQFFFIHSILAFKFLRLAGFILLIALFINVYLQLYREAGDKFRESVLMALGIVTLPTPVLHVFFASETIIGLLVPLMVTVAYGRIYSAYHDDRGKLKKFLIGYGILFSTFFIYSPMSYFFLVFTVWRALMTGKNRDRVWAIRSCAEIIMMGLLSALYFVALKVIATNWFMHLIFRNPTPQPGGQYSTTVSFDFQHYYAVSHDFLTRSLGVWFDGSINSINTVGIIIAVTLIIRAIGSLQRKDEFYPALAILILLAAFILAAAPDVIPSGGFVMVRNLYVGYAIISVALMTGIFGCCDTFAIHNCGIYISSAIVLAALSVAEIESTLGAFNSHLELMEVGQALGPHREEIIQSKGIVMHFPNHQTTPIGITDDFGISALNWPTYNLVSGIVNGVLQDMEINYRNYFVSSTFAPCDFHLIETVDVCVQDNGDMRFNNTEHKTLIDMHGNFSGKSAVLSVLNVPSNSEMTFQSTITNDHPVTFDFIYNSEKLLRSYGFRAGTDAQERMPNSWKLFGTHDGKNWELLDVRDDPKPWAVDEGREYGLAATEKYKGYRVVIERIGDGDILRIYGLFLNF